MPVSPENATLALFCKVVDNFGDIGICYRLARQLVTEHRIAVSLYVDDLVSFQRICPEIIPGRDRQQVDNINVIHWRDQNGSCSADEVADIVIEFFGCELPPSYISAMQIKKPVWINLEGLSAEDWVEGCHTLPSPQNGQTKYFFYPGFTKKTGGLLLEAGLLQQREQFQQRPEPAAHFLAQLGVTQSEMAAVKASLFCYPNAPVKLLFDAWENGAVAVTCLVPEGVAREHIAAFLGQPANAGATARRGNLSVRVIPFLPQADYDKLLWSCDINFVRGEDSFVRAQWAGRPFIWHIYPQDNELHHVKLKAFLQRYSAITDSLVALNLGWNDASEVPINWPAVSQELIADAHKIANMAPEWQSEMLTNGDLASNLLNFAASVKQKADENKL